MRDRTIPFPGKDWWLRLGTDPGHRYHRQAAETHRRRLCELHHQVGLDLRLTLRQLPS